MHRNPVKRGLVTAPGEWKCSSFRTYACGEEGLVKVNCQEWPVRITYYASRSHSFENRKRVGHPAFLFEPNDRGRKLAVLLRTYIDDSKDETQQKYFTAAALVGSHDEWGHFNREWKRVLRISPRIKYFHAKEWRGLDGEFRQFRDPDKWPRPKGGEAADEKRNSPRDVIEKS